MLYVSTRGKTDLFSAAHAITRGLAADGGLFVPQNIPAMRMVDIKAMERKPYTERAVDVLLQYLTDFSEDELRECVNAAYAPEKFGDNPVPLVQVNDNTGVLELWHGPTSAFKDMALQLLPHLLTRSMQKTGETNKVVILVATSGDTGKAALEGFADVPGTQIIVFYPSEGVSDIQKQQMITQAGKNVKVFGIEGNFDDAQRGVKEIFGNTALSDELEKKGYTFSSANSINWGRLVPQIVYYFSAYVDAVKAGKITAGDPINFVVPTGNFGDILAGYFARELGLPVGRLVCASNANNVLTEFLRTGRYDRNRPFYKTVSPSMDILVSSNLERLLYLMSGDAALVAQLMAQLKETGVYQVPDALLEKMQSVFWSGCCDDAATKAAIGRLWKEQRYLADTHTAVAWQVAQDYKAACADHNPVVVLSTASPYKFPAAVLEGLGEQPEDDEFAVMERLHALTGVPVPPNLASLRQQAVRHRDVIDREDMLAYVLKKAGEPVWSE